MTCESDFTVSHGGMLVVKRNLDYENKPNSTCTTQFFSNCRHIKRRRNAEKSNSGWSIGGQIFCQKSPSPTSPCLVDFGLVSPEHLVQLVQLLLQKKVIEYYYSKLYSKQQYCTHTHTHSDNIHTHILIRLSMHMRTHTYSLVRQENLVHFQLQKKEK